MSALSGKQLGVNALGFAGFLLIKFIRKTPNLLFVFFHAFSYFFHFFQVKKVNFEKVWAAWEKPSPLLFCVLIFHFFTTTLLFSHDITGTTPIVSSTFPNEYVCQ